MHDWEIENLIIRFRGCQNYVFGDVKFIVLGIILEFILELKMHPKSHCLTLGTACGHFDPPLECKTKSNANGNRFFPELSERGGHEPGRRQGKAPHRRDQGAC